MAKIKVLANAYVVTSTLKANDIANLKKFHPDQLTIRTDKGDDIFSIGIGQPGTGSIKTFGIVFDGKDSNGYAQVTALFPEGVEAADRKKFLMNNKIGAALLMLNKYESAFASNLTALDVEMTSIDNNIEVVDAPAAD